MASPGTAYVNLLQSCKVALEKFQASKSSFRIIASINPLPQTHSQNKRSHEASSKAPSPATLFILDSSYNPPSRAHATLATSAVRTTTSTPADQSANSPAKGTKVLTKHSKWSYPGPARLLLLFSTANADKAAKPASFEHRLAMLVLFAEDLSEQWAAAATEPSSQSPLSPLPQTPIDIGLTNEPIYHDKSTAITSAASSNIENSPASSASPPNQHAPANPDIYSKAQHIHLIGYDTIIRVFNPKYYKSHDPPLSALNEYFDSGHGFRATIRPASTEDSEERQNQLRWVKHNLANGALKRQGGKQDWADHVEMVEAEEDIGDVSSTRVREAVEEGKWEDIGKYCSGRVSLWIQEFGLYSKG